MLEEKVDNGKMLEDIEQGVNSPWGEANNIELLAQTMDVFNRATIKLQQSYDDLKVKTENLRAELESKNQKLANMATVLESILNNAVSSIVVKDSSNNIVLINNAGRVLHDFLGTYHFHELLLSPSGAGIYERMIDIDKGAHYKISAGPLSLSDGGVGWVFVIDDISELKALERVRQISEKLQLIGEVSANIAHDIRNPLGSIEIFASLLDRELTNNPRQKQLISYILKSAKTINGIVSNTLLFTKDLEIVKNEYLLCDIVDDVVLYLQHIFKAKEVFIDNQLNEDDVVSCEKDLFRQAVMNLLHNAIDAVPSTGGHVELRCWTADDEQCLSIRDNGAGIEPEMLSKLFMPFATTKAKGTGLGLCIAQKIIKCHSGRIEVKSEVGKYTEFFVFLPLIKKSYSN